MHHPQQAQPRKPAQHPGEQGFGPVAFRGAGGRDFDAQHQSEGVHEQVPLAALDLFGGIVTHRATVGIGLDALTVQDRRRGPAPLALGGAHMGAELGVERLPGVVERPLAKDVIDGLPRREVGGQQAPLDAAFDHVEDRIQDAPPVGGRAAALAGLGEHRFEESPLGVRETGGVGSDFHRPESAALRFESALSVRYVKSFTRFFSSPISRGPADF